MRAIRTSGSVRGGLPGETGDSTGFTPRMAGQDVPGVERPRRAEPPTRQCGSLGSVGIGVTLSGCTAQVGNTGD